MHSTLLLTFLLLIITQYNVYGQNDDCCEEYCYSTDNVKEQSNHYATKTAYEYVRPKDQERSRILNVPQECTATKLWILSRHGTRLPDTKFIKRMNQLMGLRNEGARKSQNNASYPGRLCTPDLINLKGWRVNSSITPDKANELTAQGYEDLRLLAKYYLHTFPSILNQTYTSGKFKFYTSKSNRTIESLKVFASGLFGSEILKDKNFRGQPLNDSFLRPQEICELYKEQNQDDKNNLESEIRKFEMSEMYNKTVEHISKRIGFSNVLPDDIIELMWDMCRYEQAWHLGRLSTWCAAFTPTQNSVLEYKEDLKYYYKSGYGHNINSRIACFTIQDMLRHFKNLEQPQVIAHFSHSALIQLFLVALGAFKDKEPLKADNFEQMKDRQWQTSSISPFAANIAAVKYECPLDSNNDPKILFLLNEKPLKLEGCNNDGLCDWSYIMTKYEELFNINCQEYYCSSTGNIIKISIQLMISFIIYLMYVFHIY